MMTTFPEELVERFWLKVDRNGPIPIARPDLGPCWLWTASTNQNGYGNFGLGHEIVGKAHRFSFELHGGSIPKKKELDHLCHVRNCVNPRHLEAVTKKVNRDRRDLFLGRGISTEKQCSRGHEFTKENTAIITRKNGRKRRYCRACWREKFHERKTLKRAVSSTVERALYKGLTGVRLAYGLPNILEDRR